MRIRIRRRYLVSLLLVVSISATSYILGWSNLVTVKEVAITGIPSKEIEASLLRKIDIEIGDRFARIDPRSVSQRLTTMEWIKKTEISRNWRNRKVQVTVIPRIPVALYSVPGGSQVALDASGKKFTPVTSLPEDLPNVVATSVESGLAAIRVFTELPADFSTGINRMSAARPGSFQIFGKFYERELRIIWGDEEDTLLKVKVIAALLERRENSKIKYIDVSAPHAPIVR